jgi:hypothetical protein
MSDDRKKWLDKIRKCLRLAASANEHEAARALSQAQALMREHQVSQDELIAAEASESRVRARAKTKPASWEFQLADMVAAATGCKLIFAAGGTAGEWMFIGTRGGEQVAQYAMAALLRQIVRSRARYIESTLRRCKVATRTRRADAYCVGWVSTVHAKVQRIALSEADSKAIAAYASRYSITQLKPIDRPADFFLRGKEREYGDWLNGRADGSGIDLGRPMSGGAQREAIES